jgi:hypothetical protein
MVFHCIKFASARLGFPFFSKIFVNKKDQAKLSLIFGTLDFGEISFLAKNYWIHSIHFELVKA